MLKAVHPQHQSVRLTMPKQFAINTKQFTINTKQFTNNAKAVHQQR